MQSDEFIVVGRRQEGGGGEGGVLRKVLKVLVILTLTILVVFAIFGMGGIRIRKGGLCSTGIVRGTMLGSRCS